MVEGGSLGMLSMFTGMGGALPERGLEIPEETTEQVCTLLLQIKIKQSHWGEK